MSNLPNYIEKYFEKNGILANNLENFEFRESQLKIANIFAKMLENGGIHIIEAGTGIGKTLAYLIPSILSLKKIVIATKSKNLQEQLFFKDIEIIKSLIPFDFKSIYIKGRNNYICLNKLSKLTIQNTFFKEKNFQKINDWVKITNTGDISELDELTSEINFLNITSTSDTCLGSKCSFFKDCFIYKLKLEAEKSDIIIVNYHLLFADFKIKNQGFGKVLPNFNFLICDEAHSIEDIATDYFGDSVSKYKFHTLFSEIANENIKDFDKLRNITEEFFLQFSNIPGFNKVNLEEIQNEKILKKAGELLNSLTVFKTNLEKKDPEKYSNIINRIYETIETLDNLFFNKNDFLIKWIEKTSKNISLKYSPIDISSFLQEFFYDLHGVAFTSATLSINRKFDYFKNRIGIEVSDTEEIFSSTFNYEKQSLMYLPENLPMPHEENFTKILAKNLKKLLNITNGNAFILFTNLKNMEEIYNLLKDEINFNLYIQGETSNLNLIEKFKNDSNSVLLGSFSFWEGIDIRGENLSLVAIEKLPFSVPTDPLKKARIEKIKEEGGNPFFDYQIPEAIMLLRQGIGRLIRSKNDKGIIALFDIRLRKKNYGKIFLKNLPKMTIHSSLEKLNQNYQKLISKN